MKLQLLDDIYNFSHIYFIASPIIILYLNICDLKYGFYLLLIHFSNDLIRKILEKDFLYTFHHILGIILAVYTIYTEIYYSIYVTTMLNTEIPTVILALRKKYPSLHMDLLFYITFAYFRVYMYLKIYFHKDLLYFTNYNYIILATVMSIGSMNLYWFYVINLKIIKKYLIN